MLPTRYISTGPVLVRATTDPGDLETPPPIDLSDRSAIEQEGRMWLAKVWGRSEVREALPFASLSLGSRVERLLDEGSRTSVKELRSAIMSVASYLLRWQRRATPFGMFAGVTTATVGPATAVVGSEHRVVIRADAEWLTTLIDQLEHRADLRSRLTVIADNARVERDGRVIVHRRAEVGSSVPGPLRESSVRLTKPVELALGLARSPVTFSALAAQMIRRFPSVSPDKIHALLDGLIEAGALITSLQAPMTTVDGLAHLVSALRAAGAEDMPEIAPLLNELGAISALLASHNSDGARARRIRTAVAERMASLAPEAGSVLAADVRLNATVVVPKEVLTEAALAASVLLRVTPEPFGSAAWLDYHARFRARYGVGALVPVRDLVADSGLGYPAGYLGAPRARPAWRMLTDRDVALLALIQKATLTGEREIALTDTDLASLTVGEPSDVVLPPRIELGVVMEADSTAAIDQGKFTLRVTAAPRTPTSMAGRFTHLLDDADRAAATCYPASEDVVAAQLSFPPRRPHNENVVRVQTLQPHVISLSEHPVTDVTSIDLEDLAVTADADQMYLVQRSTGRRVIPHLPHALDLKVQTPPLARFLAEVADARSAVFRSFDLGAARALPYVPRIRYRRTVLVPARWLFAAEDVHSQSSFDDALTTWRRRWRVPARVVVVHGELRLPLDLDQSLDRIVLHTHLARAERLELHEDGPPDGGRWIGRPAELLIPLVAISQPARPLPVTTAPGPVRRPGNSDVLHAQLTGNPARFDDILTIHLPQLIDNLGEPVVRWWVRRHRDLIRPETDQHLAFAIRLTDRDHYGPVAATVAAFASGLEARGLPCQLALASLPHHPAQYGSSQVVAMAEQVFATDTAAAIAQIACAQASKVPAQALAAASMTALAAAFAPDPTSGYQALITSIHQEHGTLDRSLRDHTLKLADPTDGRATVQALPGGDALVAAWSAREDALTTYYRALASQQDPRPLLRTLLHDHHVRAIGVDPTIEKETCRLARTAALRRLALAGAL